jgi:hypothetical protein
MFITVVLMVIAIGVGVVAATTNQHVYGPSWGRFSASFPGHVYSYQSTTIKFPYFSYSTGPGSIVYPPLSNAARASLLGVSVVRGAQARQFADNERLFSGVAVQHQRANGFSVLTTGPLCTKGTCAVVEYILHGPVLWTLVAVSKGRVSTIESFLDSFQPIG